jgi:hypothetical protein
MVTAEGLANGKQNMSSLLNKPQTKDKVYYFNMTLMPVCTIMNAIRKICCLSKARIQPYNQ